MSGAEAGARAQGPPPAPPGPGPVRVLLCDDSATVRGALRRLLVPEPDIAVIGTAADGREALALIAALPPEARPQVVVLDLEMPVMDGMTALPQLLRQAPRPAVIVASSLTQRGAAAALAALRAGAMDYIPKPSAASGGQGLAGAAFRAELLAKLRGWGRMVGGGATAPAPRPAMPPAPGIPPAVSLPAAAPSAPGLPAWTPRAIGIACSTGGPQALGALLRGLGAARLPVPVLITQHMPSGFTAMLADHLTRHGGPPCAEAREGEILRPGRLHLAPGDRHLLAEAAGGALVARLSAAPPENFCRPAADPMLRSLAAACAGRVLTVVLTGMGQDGLAGCRAVAEGGGVVLAQDEASAVVWGMPGAVARAGLAQAQLPPEALAARILLLCGVRPGAPVPAAGHRLAMPMQAGQAR